MADETTEGKLNRLCKWRSVFAGWQLGTRPKGDPECDAVRDHREATIILRCEVTALTALLIEKGLFTAVEDSSALGVAADLLSAAYERRFPGMKATDDGIALSLPEAITTMAGWRP